jgi:hypothetical protein
MGKPTIPKAIDHELMLRMGLRIEGPGDVGSAELVGRYWWTWHREGWSGIECGPCHATWLAAAKDAWEALWSDPDSEPELTVMVARDSALWSGPVDRGPCPP